MKSNKNIRSKTYFSIIMWSIFIIATGTFIAYLFQGTKLFSSFSYFMTYASLGYAYGFAFGGGNWLIGAYTEKFDWAKNPKKANLISFILLIGYGILVSIMVPYLVDRFLWGMTGKDIFYDVMTKAFMTIALDMMVIYFYYSNHLANHWIKAIEKNEELKRENLMARYEALKNQVNPHFLFNSLNTLSGVVEKTPELATAFIKKLSDIYRYVLEQNDKELVALSSELKFVEDYVFLSKMRFGKGLIYGSTISANENILVIPLGLQMLVENAIKHNILSDDMPLNIEMEIDGGSITVKNNIQKKTTIHSGKEPLGLENLKKRYGYLSNKEVEVMKTDNKFIVKLPIIEP